MLLSIEPTNKDTIIANFSAENLTLKTENFKLSGDLQEAHSRISLLEEQLRLAAHKRFGKQTEQTSTLQMQLFDEFPEPPVEEPPEKETICYEREKPKKKGRRVDTANLPRKRIEYDLADTEKQCSCGQELSKIGEDISEQIDFIPAYMEVIEHAKAKYCCKQCQTIKSAIKPEQPLGKCMATERFVADVIIKKYEHHLPLYRQSKILLQNGADIPDNTLGNWVMAAADALYPLSTAMWEQINTVKVLQADETPVKVLEQDKKGYMWGYRSCHPKNSFVMFEFNLSRSGDIPKKRLSSYSGILQTDAYGGYNSLRLRKDIINIGCWDHARRKFTDAIKVYNNNKAGLAGKILLLINKLYDVERDAKGKPFDVRYALRQKHSKPILDDIYKMFTQGSAFPKSLLGKALTYLSNNWSELIEYIKHGEAEISTCWIENENRPIAIGRKNWMFVGNECSANKAALLYSLIQTCKLNGINARDYLIYILKQAHKLRRKEIEPATLLPQFIDKSLL